MDQNEPLSSDPRTRSDWARFLYDERGPSYENSFHPTFAELMVRSVPRLHRGDKVLDVAAGTGLCTFAAAARVAPSGQVLGVDASPGMLKVARSKKDAFVANVTRQHGHCNESLIQLAEHDVTDLGSLEVLQGQQGTFDAVICASALVLLDDPKAAIASWVQYLKPGTGRLVVDVPHPHNARAGAIMESAARQIYHYQNFPYHRHWVTSEDSFRAGLEACVDPVGKPLLHVEEVRFEEQVGYGIRRYSGRREEAEKLFEGTVKPFHVGNDLKRTASLREAFLKEWEKAADEKGFVEDVDGAFVAIAKCV